MDEKQQNIIDKRNAVLDKIMAGMTDHFSEENEPGSNVKSLDTMKARLVELQSLLKLYNDDAIRKEVLKIESDILKITDQDNVVKRFFSRKLGENFNLLANGIIVFDNGARYTEDELNDLDDNALKIVHYIKSHWKTKYIGEGSELPRSERKVPIIDG